jgi:hypothetical protein
MISGVFVSPNKSSTYPPTRVREVQSPLIQTRAVRSRSLYSESSDTLQKSLLIKLLSLSANNSFVIPIEVSGQPLVIQRRIGVRRNHN